MRESGHTPAEVLLNPEFQTVTIHFRYYSTSLEAKKADVYSFGMLCLWILFGSMPVAHNSTEYAFDASTGPCTPLEQLKYDDKMEHLANQLMESVQLMGLNAEHRIRLKELFSLTVKLSPRKGTSDLRKLVCLLSQKQ